MSIQDDWNEPGPRRRGMSTAAKVLVFLGAVGGLCLLLCCGGSAFFFWKAKDVFKNAISVDPDQIRARTRKMAHIEIPGDLTPTQTVDAVFMRWVIYEKQPDDGSRLKLLELDREMINSGNPELQRQQMLDMLQQQGSRAGGEGGIDVENSETRDLAVNGQSARFEFSRGKDRRSGQAMRQVTGVIELADSVVILVVIRPSDQFDEAAVVRMIESIGEPDPDSDSDEAQPPRAEKVETQPPAELHGESEPQAENHEANPPETRKGDIDRGDTRQGEGEQEGTGRPGAEPEGDRDSSP